jgi:hypothetical protein
LKSTIDKAGVPSLPTVSVIISYGHADVFDATSVQLPSVPRACSSAAGSAMGVWLGGVTVTCTGLQSMVQY